MADARCRVLHVDGDVFFPTSGAEVEAAQRICAVCPVRRDCLEYALDNSEDHGVWGGESERSRRRIRRQRAVMAGRTPARSSVERQRDDARKLHRRGWSVMAIANEFDTTQRSIWRWLDLPEGQQ